MPIRFRLGSAVALLGLFAVPALPSAGYAQARPATTRVDAGQQQSVAIFDKVWSEVAEHYYDPTYNGVDWQTVRSRYRPAALTARDDPALLDILREMLAELRDPHTRILGAQQVSDRREGRTTTSGVILFDVDGVPVVYDVIPGSAAAEAGLRPGLRVLEVNETPIAEALQRARTQVGPSTSERASKVLAYLRLIGGPAREPLRLLLQEPGGSRVRVALNRRRIDARPRFEAQRLEGEILHVRFDRFRKPVARLLRQTLERHRDATALILDLRSNTGGDGEEGVRVVAPLLDRPTVIARLSTRTGRPPSALLGLVRLPMVLTAGQTGRQLFRGPIVILINEGTGSTSEVIAASLQEQGRAVVAGSRSCGCALGVLRHRALPNGAALAISEVGLVTARGKRIEGDGVSPDLPVTMNIQDMITGRDPVLSRAIAYLLGQG